MKEKTTESIEKNTENNKKDFTKPEVKKIETYPVMYVGPTFPHKLYQNTVYKNGIPQIAKEIIEKHPEVSQMFVKLDRVSDMKKELATKNSASSIIFAKIKNNMKEE